MKYLCVCGHVISDSTDYIPYKAKLIADQDFFNFLDEMESSCEYKRIAAQTGYFSDVFQCANCNNLIIFSADFKRRCDFQPINKAESANITLSQIETKKTQ